MTKAIYDFLNTVPDGTREVMLPPTLYGDMLFFLIENTHDGGYDIYHSYEELRHEIHFDLYLKGTDIMIYDINNGWWDGRGIFCRHRTNGNRFYHFMAPPI